MTTGATGQLGLALPVQGELSGTWGDTVNNGLTQYINIAIAGTLTLTNDGAVTLANTTGDASASNVTSTLTGAGTVTAQFAIVRVTGTLTVAKVVTGPSYSKTYTVVNAATGGIVTFKAAGQTGVSVAVGESAFVYFNGTDYVKVSGTASVTSFSAGTTGLTPSTSTTGAVTLAGTLAIANGGTGQTTANTALNALLPSQTGNANKYLQTDGTNSSWDAVSLSTADITGTLGTANGGTGLTSFTSGGVVYASSTSALATGSALTFDGTNLGAGGASSPSAPVDIQANSGATAIRIRGRASANAGTLRFFANDNTTQRARFESNDTSFEINSIANLPITFLTNDTEAMRLTSTSLYTASGINVGIGTSSPAQKLDVSGSGTISARVSSTTGNATFILNSASTFYNYLQYSSAGSGGLIFYDATNSVNRMVLDSAGNLGLGVTPSAWEAGYQVFENSGGSFFSGSGSVVRTVQGGYINSGYKYKYTGVAAGLYAMSAGSHQWSTAASGTAGDAISFTQAATLTADGHFLVGTTSAGGGANVKGVTLNNAGQIAVERDGGIAGVFNRFTSDGQVIIFRRSGTTVGSIDVTTTATSYVTSSDQRLKTNIVDAPEGNVDAIKIRSFDWIADGSHQTYGVVAQELLEIAPYAVSKQNDPQEMMGVDYSKLVPMLIKEMQALRQRVATLEAQ